MLSLADQLRNITPPKRNKKAEQKDKEIARVMQLLLAETALTPAQVRDRLGYTHSATLRYLAILRDQKRVEYYRSGGVTRIQLTPEEKTRGYERVFSRR
jgi:hypothetical protein